MKSIVKGFPALALGCVLLLSSIGDNRAHAASAVFGGGPFYSGGTAVMNTLRGSGFTTVILWCIHVDANTGNLILNDQLVVANGAYVGNAAWPGQLATLKTPPTSVNRIEVSIGSWGVNDFQSVQTLMNNYGTNTTSILYRNFLALKNATGATAADFDDETLYDITTAVKFGQMLSSIGYKITLCPYTNPAFWQSVYNQLGSGKVDTVYLQCYAGGAGNNPSSWNSYFSGLKVTPGLWCSNGSGCASGDDPASVGSKMQAWKLSADIPGGFMWLYDDMLACASQGSPANYAAAINAAVDPFKIFPAVGFSAVAGPNGRYLPASTSFTLTNTASAALGWRISTPASWLTPSGASGTLAAHTGGTVTVSLNSASATNLPPGRYLATLWFTNLSTGVSSPRAFSLNTGVTNWPVSLSGWNAALLAPNTATPANPRTTAFDVPNNYCFYEAGLPGGSRGLPADGGFASLCDSSTAFQLGPFGAPDALLLGYRYANSGTLTLTPAQAFYSLEVLACSANGGGQGSLVLHFADGGSSPAFAFNAQDWFYTTTNVALQGFGRLKLGTSFAFEDNGDSNPNFYETSFNLLSRGLTNPVSSITFSMPANAGTQQNTGIFALSGSPIPVAPPTVDAVLDGQGHLQLSWSGGGTLLQATNLSGPWTTNSAHSPALIIPDVPRMFYRVQVR